ncbi:MAG: isoprenyl transferase [Thermodesulfobacteriota bacterium]
MKYKDPAPDLPELDPARLPRHIAIIMDGNGRWARQRSLERLEGHRRGVQVIESIVTACTEIGVSYLTLYAFSTENWQRPAPEVEGIMSLLRMFLAAKQQELKDNGVRLRVVGEVDMLPAGVREALDRAIEHTKGGNALVLTLALSYGGRAEITAAARRIAADAAAGRIDAGAIDEAVVSRYLYTHDMPDPDLMIRTSGEMRISNFLLWQLAYSEIYVTPTLWPDFDKAELVRIIGDFQRRDRRFGKV